MLSNTLRLLVSRKAMTQKDIATELGISQQRFNFYVNGSREPDVFTLNLLANYFGVTVDYLIGDQKERPTLVSESGPSDDDLIRLWRSLSPDEILRMKDFAQGMIANRKNDPSRPE